MVRLDKVPHDPHVAVTSLREVGVLEQVRVVVYHPIRSTAVWGAEYTRALDAMKSICGCDVHLQPHGVYQPTAHLSPHPTASNAASLGRGGVSLHSDVAWLEPRRYCWVPAAVKVTSCDASP